MTGSQSVAAVLPARVYRRLGAIQLREALPHVVVTHGWHIQWQKCVEGEEQQIIKLLRLGQGQITERIGGAAYQGIKQQRTWGHAGQHKSRAFQGTRALQHEKLDANGTVSHAG